MTDPFSLMLALLFIYIFKAFIDFKEGQFEMPSQCKVENIQIYL